jgi:hypothetical protein
LRVKLNHELFEKMAGDYEFPDVDGSPAKLLFIGPNTNSATYMSVLVDTLIAAVDRKQRMFIWGWATYDDVFEGTPQRLTEFCSEISITFTERAARVAPPEQNPAAAALLALQAPQVDLIPPVRSRVGLQTDVRMESETCDRHNCYDEDCPNYQQRTKS